MYIFVHCMYNLRVASISSCHWSLSLSVFGLALDVSHVVRSVGLYLLSPVPVCFWPCLLLSPCPCLSLALPLLSPRACRSVGLYLLFLSVFCPFPVCLLHLPYFPLILSVCDGPSSLFSVPDCLWPCTSCPLPLSFFFPALMSPILLCLLPTKPYPSLSLVLS